MILRFSQLIMHKIIIHGTEIQIPFYKLAKLLLNNVHFIQHVFITKTFFVVPYTSSFISNLFTWNIIITSFDQLKTGLNNWYKRYT